MRAACAHPQRGAALFVILALIGIAAASLTLGMAKSASDHTARDRLTAAALGQAREALIARAVNDRERPGSLPCPDIDDDGEVNLSCGPIAEGRLPWKTLGFPDLRDGYGERLWYRLSANFRDLPLNTELNSDTAGQLDVIGPSPLSGVIAIVIAPGTVIGTQSRASIAERNDVANYLDGENANSDATFEDALPTDAFNDRLLAITGDMLFPAVERRVVRQARRCLDLFSQQAGANGRFPWATPVTDLINFADSAGTFAGRIPLTLTATNSTLPTTAWPTDPLWPAINCFQNTGQSWWRHWKEHLFYHVAQAYSPTGSGACVAAGDCLVANGVVDVKVAVIVAGRALTGSPDQSARSSDQTQRAYYLETDPVSGTNNATGDGSLAYVRAARRLDTTSFNDSLSCLHATAAWPCQ